MGFETPTPTWRKQAFWKTPPCSLLCYLTLNQVLKAGVINGSGRSACFDPQFLALCGYFCLQPITYEWCDPESKGIVEGTVHYIKPNALTGRTELKDVLALRPIYHQVEPRVRAHIFVAALALLVQRLLDRRLREAGIEFSSIRAMEALCTVRHVAFRVDGEDKRSGVAGGSPNARRVLNSLKIGDLRPPTPANKLADTVM